MLWDFEFEDDKITEETVFVFVLVMIGERVTGDYRLGNDRRKRQKQIIYTDDSVCDKSLLIGVVKKEFTVY